MTGAGLVSNSHVVGVIRDDQSAVVDLTRQIADLNRDVIDGCGQAVDGLRNEIVGTRQVTSQLTNRMVQLADKLNQLHLRIRQVTLNLQAARREDAERVDGANQLSDQLPVFVDDASECGGVVEIADRVALDVDDVPERRFGDVDKSIDPTLYLIRQAVVRIRHHSLLALHGLVTRHVTGALSASRRWLQRMGWARRAAVSSPRPSGTTNGGDTA